MIRWLGAALVVGGGLWLGLNRTLRREERVRQLRTLALALEQMEREMREASPPMERLLSGPAALGGVPGACFAALRAGLSGLEERPFARLWAEAFRTAELLLTEGERQRLTALGMVLGRYEQESQRRALRRTAEDLRRSLEEAREERRRLGRLDCVLGGAAGLLAVIFLF